MWITKIKNGKYRINERYIDPATEKARVIGITFDTNEPGALKEAKKNLKEMLDRKTNVEGNT